jgi:hypothetical protein
MEELRREREHAMFAKGELLDRSVGPTLRRLLAREWTPELEQQLRLLFHRSRRR